MTLFDDDTGAAMQLALIERLRDAYRKRLLDNPPTPAFMETNPHREGAAHHATKRDIARLMAVLDAEGITLIGQDELTRLRERAAQYEDLCR